MRALATLTALITVAVVAAHAVATTVRVPTVSCSDIILQVKSGRQAGYRVVLGIVSVPPAQLTQVVATNSTPWAYWRKAGLVIRASHTPVGVSIPKAWRKRAAITWGSSGNVSALKIAPCPSASKVWNAYAGGFYIRAPRECVPLTFTVGRRSQTVRFGVGGACPTG
jgi:hypothetical protein